MRVILLAMHGAPPRDFPPRELGEFFGLHARLEHASESEGRQLRERYAELEAKVRAWPRTSQNDPFWAASQALAAQLNQVTGREVVLGFNEFCAPDLDEALEQAIKTGAEQVVVVTPMMTRGGKHAEKDIPAAVRRAQERHPAVSLRYVWPFEVASVAQFLAQQVDDAVQRPS